MAQCSMAAGPWVIFQLWVCGQVHLSTLRLMGTGHKPWAWDKLLLAPTALKPKPTAQQGSRKGEPEQEEAGLPCSVHIRAETPARINSLPPGKASCQAPQHCGHQRTVFFLEMWILKMTSWGLANNWVLRGKRTGRWRLAPRGLWKQSRLLLHGNSATAASVNAQCSPPWAKLQPGVKSSHRNVHPKGDHWDKF